MKKGDKVKISELKEGDRFLFIIDGIIGDAIWRYEYSDGIVCYYEPPVFGHLFSSYHTSLDQEVIFIR